MRAKSVEQYGEMVSVDCVSGLALDFVGFRHFELVGCAVEHLASGGGDVVAVKTEAREAANSIFLDPMSWRQRNSHSQTGLIHPTLWGKVKAYALFGAELAKDIIVGRYYLIQ